MSLRKIAGLLVAGALSIGLIGAGAAATFTQTTVSAQDVQSGSMNVVLSGAGVLSNSDHTLTFALYGPTGSTFTTGDNLVTITNVGNISVQEITEQISWAGDAGLMGELSVCETSSGTVIYNGLLSGGLALQAIAGTLAPTATDSYTINVYAGNVTTACGAVTAVGATAVPGISTSPSLTIQNKTVTISVTVGYSA